MKVGLIKAEWYPVPVEVEVMTGDETEVPEDVWRRYVAARTEFEAAMNDVLEHMDGGRAL